MKTTKAESVDRGIVKQFRVPAKQAITVRFLNPQPQHTRIKVGGKLLTGDIKIPATSGKRKLSFRVEFRKRPGEEFLHMTRQLGVEIQAGGKKIRDMVLPDLGGLGIHYLFVAEDPDPGLTWCPKHKIIVRGHCPKCL